MTKNLLFQGVYILEWHYTNKPVQNACPIDSMTLANLKCKPGPKRIMTLNYNNRQVQIVLRL
jgi:hypothetical protein